MKRNRAFDALCGLVLCEFLWSPWEHELCEWWKEGGKNRRSDGPTDEKSEDSGNFSRSSTSSQQGQTQQGSNNKLKKKYVCNSNSSCRKHFPNPYNRRRHYKNVHKEYLCDILDCLSTFNDTKELDDHQEQPHPCPICGKLFKGNISLGIARKHLNTHGRPSSTEAEWDLDTSFCPELHSTRIDDVNTSCCNLRHKTLGPMLELTIKTEDKHGISLMALIFSFVIGPEDIYSSTPHITHSIARYGKLYSSCSIRLPSTIILDDPSLKTSVSVDLMEEHGGTFRRTSFESCFQKLCILGNYGIFTINQVPIAVVLTNDKLYAFNVDAKEDDGSISRLRVCMQSHPRSECLEDFLYEYLQSTRDPTESANSSSISHTEDSLKDNFSFKIISLK